MTTVKAMYTKLNGAWVKSSSGGEMTEVMCPNVSTTNNSGFKVGNVSCYTNSISWSQINFTNGSYTSPVYTTIYVIPTAQVTSYCQPFTFDGNDIISELSAPSVSISQRLNTQGWAGYASYIAGLKAIRTSTGAVLASTTGSLPYQESYKIAYGTLTISFTLPSNWNYSTDTITVQAYSYCDYGYQGFVYAGTRDEVTLQSVDAYYNPVVSA